MIDSSEKSTTARVVADLDFDAQRLQANLRAKMFGIESGPVRIGRYAILRMLGRGTTGAVYAAYDEHRDRRVAIKLMARPGVGWREAQILTQLSHDHVVAAHDVGTFDDRVYVAMEYISGPTLAAWLTCPRTTEQIVDVYLQAGRGLAAAHRAGIVHRDVKPANLMIGPADPERGERGAWGTNGRVRLVDFGLARHATCRSPLDHIEGTPAFMAPEQLERRSVDALSDQFSFCLALFDALFGDRAHPGRRSRQVLLGVLDGVRALAPRRTDVPRRIVGALERGLARDPADRFHSMDALLAVVQPDRGLLDLITGGARLVR